MVKVNYKQIPFGDKFIFEGVEYIKTNHSRGYYYENARKVLKKFKNKAIVDSKVNNWDKVPPLQ